MVNENCFGRCVASQWLSAIFEKLDKKSVLIVNMVFTCSSSRCNHKFYNKSSLIRSLLTAASHRSNMTISYSPVLKPSNLFNFPPPDSLKRLARTNFSCKYLLLTGDSSKIYDTWVGMSPYNFVSLTVILDVTKRNISWINHIFGFYIQNGGIL